MALAASQRDRLRCASARESEQLDDAELETPPRAWLDGPRQPLVRVLAAHARLTPAAEAAFQSAADARLRELESTSAPAPPARMPPAVERLLHQAHADTQHATTRQYETRP